MLEHFGEGAGETEAGMDAGRLGQYLLYMVGRAFVRGSAGQSSKSWCSLLIAV